MTTIITSGEFSVDAASIDWLRQVAPDIEAVLRADTTSQMCEAVTVSEAPVVTIISGIESQANIENITDAFTAGATPGGVVAVGSAKSHDVVTQAFRAGAKGWVLPNSPVEELVTAIRAVADGHVFLPSALLKEVAYTVLPMSTAPGADEPGGDLTSRELDVLRFLAVGDPNADIAVNLFISEATVHSHVLNILRKLNARNRTEAVAMVYQRGIVRPARAAAL